MRRQPGNLPPLLDIHPYLDLLAVPVTIILMQLGRAVEVGCFCELAR